MFRGKYHGKKKHDGKLFKPVAKRTHNSLYSTDDFDAMLERSRAAGVKSMIITGGSLKESEQALKLARENSQFPVTTLAGIVPLYLFRSDLYATVGCHPTRSSEFDKFQGGPEAYLNALDKLIESNLNGKGRVVAIGECGLGD